MHWFGSLIRFVESIYWFDSLIRFNDSIHWFDSLIRKREKTITLFIAIDEQEALLIRILVVCFEKTAKKVRKPLRVSSKSMNKRHVWWESLLIVSEKQKRGGEHYVFHRHRSTRNTFDENPCRCFRKHTKKNGRNHLFIKTENIASYIIECIHKSGLSQNPWRFFKTAQWPPGSRPPWPRSSLCHLLGIPYLSHN